MEILCTFYPLPKRLIESQRGREQYDSLQGMVSDASGVASLLQRLEERYDRDQRDEADPANPLSPSIEEFLKDLGQGFQPPSV